MKIVLFLVLSATMFLQSVNASTYYFSNNTGNDDRTPRQAQNPSTPWKSLSKLNAYFSSLQPGDKVLLKRGEIFYGSITVNSSGIAGSPIMIGAYGTGSKPVITSLVTLSGWAAKDNYKGVYESSPVASAGTNVNTVLINNEIQQLGRYPNSDAANKGYLTFEAHSGKTSITDNELSSPINWTGAELVLRSQRWVLDRNLITSQSGNTIFYQTSSKYEPYDKYGYFIQNDIKTLDKTGEWYFNPSSKQVSVFFGKNKPSSYTVQVPTIDNLISSSDNSHIVFDNLQIKGANICGFLVKSGSDISISNCDVLFSGRDGVKVANIKNFDIENCIVANSNNNGVDLGFNGSNNAVIKNNIITNTGVLAGMSGSGDGKALAVQSNGSGADIENNQIINTGYTGIYFSGDLTVIKNNFIDSFCQIKDDGAAIYTFSGSKSNTVHKGRIVDGNVIVNGIGAPEGTNSKNSAANGIYMDVGATGVEITNNTVANTYSGIFFHKANRLVATNNTLYNNTNGLYIVNNGGSFPITNNVVTNNLFFPKDPKQLAVNIETVGDDIESMGVFDSNFYWGTTTGNVVFKQRSKDNLGNMATKRFALNDWKNAHPYDLSSKNMPLQVAANTNLNNIVRFEYNTSNDNKRIALNGQYTDVKGKFYTKSVVLPPYSSIILVKQTGKKIL